MSYEATISRGCLTASWKKGTGSEVVTLAEASKGDTLQVVAVPSGPVGDQLLRLGIAKGSRLTCVLKIPGGPVVVRRGNMELALGRKTASAVTVDRPDA